jgi:hypothetical protein
MLPGASLRADPLLPPKLNVTPGARVDRDVDVAPVEHVIRQPYANLWFRTWLRPDAFAPLTSLTHTERVVMEVNDANPWVTIAYGDPDGPHRYFQALGNAARMTVEGGDIEGARKLSWWVSALPMNVNRERVGPVFFDNLVWASSLVTVFDAIALLCPLLFLPNPIGAPVSGFRVLGSAVDTQRYADQTLRW